MSNRQKIGSVIIIMFFFVALGLAGSGDLEACRVGGQC